MVDGVSFLGQSISQIQRFKQLNVTLADLQRQVATQKKYDDFSGFGLDAGAVQRLRMDSSRLTSYLDNIKTATTRINIMSDALTRSAGAGREILQAIQSQVREGTVDLATIKAQAQQNIAFLGQLANSNVDGRYLFSGSVTDTPPLQNTATLNTTMQDLVTDWLDGTITTAQLMTNLDSLSPTALGFDPAIGGAGNVNMRVSETIEVDYTSLATQNGLSDLAKALGLAANLKEPGAGDIPTRSEFFQVLDKITSLSRDAYQKIDADNAALSSKFALVKRVEKNHTQDLGLFQTLTAEKENADPTEAITRIQALQTQLQASYQVTALASQLSLINFLR